MLSQSAKKRFKSSRLFKVSIHPRSCQSCPNRSGCDQTVHTFFLLWRSCSQTQTYQQTSNLKPRTSTKKNIHQNLKSQTSIPFHSLSTNPSIFFLQPQKQSQKKMCTYDRVIFHCRHATLKRTSLCSAAQNDPNHHCPGGKVVTHVWTHPWMNCEHCGNESTLVRGFGG